MCGFLIHQRDHTGVNGMQAIQEMSYRGLRTKYRGYKTWKEYDMLHTALPMVDPDPDVSIQPIQYDDEPPSLFVGEIFNYKDFGDYPSDAHMIHSKYREELNHEFFHKFDGFWSYVTFFNDAPIAYTDFLGIKPIYYRRDVEVMASEPDVLKQYGPVTKDEIFHSNVMKWGYDPQGGTPWNEIHQLKPGHFLYKGREYPYWDWGSVPVSNLYDDLSLAVKLRLGGFRDAAVLLSGGLDSTIVYQLIKQQGLNVTAIHVDNHEEKYAKMVESNLVKVTLDDVSDQDAVRIHQSPVDLGSVKPQIAMARKLKELGFHNVLTGDGADELFGGYRRAAEYDSQMSDIFCELPFYHLPKLDRTMMRSTVELRAPFLAPSVIVHALSSNYEDRNGEKKILKETFKDIIPPKILNRKKEPLKTDAIREDKMKQRKINAQIWEDLYGQTNS
jgi:asparagine synthetase B (glutamine-hydrolysing)